MLTLGLDTATAHASVAVVEAGVELAGWRQVTHQDLLRTLAEKAHQALREAGRSFADVGLIAVGLGPGSFTSLRVGLATAKGFALAHGLPLLGVPSLEAMAWPLRFRLSGLVCPVLDAKRGEVYRAQYRLRAGEVEPVEAASVATIADLVARLAQIGEQVTVLAASDLPPEAQARLSGLLWPEPQWPEAAAVAALAELRFGQRGGDDLASLRPIYVRVSYAEESRKLDLGLR